VFLRSGSVDAIPEQVPLPPDVEQSGKTSLFAPTSTNQEIPNELLLLEANVSVFAMNEIKHWLDRTDARIAGWMDRYGHPLLRGSLGLVFIWFGLLKPLGMSPADTLVRNTVYWFDPDWFVPFLGWWEVAIGVGLLYRPLIRGAIFLLFLQMPGTFMPLILLPEVCFHSVPFGLTMEGQYIVKNIVLISASLVVGGTVRKGGNSRGDEGRYSE